MDALEIEWDNDNLDHLARHGITPEEVEELFEGSTVRRRGGTDAPDRSRILGRTAAGRYLAIVVQQKGAKADPAVHRLGHASTREGLV